MQRPQPAVAPATQQPQPAVAQTPTSAEPPGPAFSWRNFIADQSIAILAYLGGFLLLVATLSFELGAGFQLDRTVKFSIIVTVYLLFGAIGLALLRMRDLKTVGNAYLGVFALMTPLVVLAGYLFEFGQLGFPPAAMICLGSGYAAIVYLALAWRTNFISYAVLGWTAFLVGLVAIVPWAHADTAWVLVAGSFVALALRFAGYLSEPMRRAGLLVSAFTAILSITGTLIADLLLWVSKIGSLPGSSGPDPAPIALAALLLTGLAVTWSVQQRARITPVAETDPFLLSDWLVAIACAHTVVAVAFWARVDGRALAVVVTLAALGEMLAAWFFRWREPMRAELRRALAGTALTLAVIAMLVGDTVANGKPPLIFALFAGAAITLSIAIMENLPVWSLGTGGFVSLAWWNIVALNAPLDPNQPVEELRYLASQSMLMLTIAVWALSLLLGYLPKARSYARWIAVVALGDAVWFTFLAFDPVQYLHYQGVVFALFTLAALISAMRERSPIASFMLVGLFGALSTFAFISNEPDHLVILIAAFAPIAAGLATSRTVGWQWARGFYAVAAWSTLLASIRFASFNASYSLSWLLLSFAVAALIVAIVERRPAFTAALAFYGVGVAVALPYPNAPALAFLDAYGGAPELIIIPVAVGGALLGRRFLLRGDGDTANPAQTPHLRWTAAAYTIAFAAAVIAAGRLPAGMGNERMTLLLILTAIAYAVVSIEGYVQGTIVPVFFALWAIGSQTNSQTLLLLAIVFSAVGMSLGRISGPVGSLPGYVVAAFAASLAVANGPATSPFASLVLVVVCLLLYLIAAVESRADVLIASFVLGVIAVLSLSGTLGWAPWQQVIALSGLSWLITGGQYLWRLLPWLRPRGASWWTEMGISADPRTAGVAAHRWGGLAVAVFAPLSTIMLPGSFAGGDVLTAITGLSWLSLALLLAFSARTFPLHILWYIAGEGVVIALTWWLRWFGVDSTQVFVVIPASCQLLVGALLGADERLGRPEDAARIISLLGALLLLVPMLSQAYGSDNDWLPMAILLLESLLVAAAGIGLRRRIITMTGAAFAGLAALRAGILAVASGLPVALVLALAALLLIGAATWLSLRSRRLSTLLDNSQSSA